MLVLFNKLEKIYNLKLKIRELSTFVNMVKVFWKLY
jgi:hypothetical protein